MIIIAYLCIIMTNGTIVLKIYLTLIFPRDKQKRKCTPSLEYIIYLEYIVHACPASFQIQNGDCVIRVYCSVSLALRNMGYGVWGKYPATIAIDGFETKAENEFYDIVAISQNTASKCLCTPRAARAA